MNICFCHTSSKSVLKGPIHPNQEDVFCFFFASFFRSLFYFVLMFSFLSVDELLFTSRSNHYHTPFEFWMSRIQIPARPSPFVTELFRAFPHSPGKRRSSTSKWAMAFSFLILFTSFFAHNFIILRYNFFIPMPPETE